MCPVKRSVVQSVKVLGGTTARKSELGKAGIFWADEPSVVYAGSAGARSSGVRIVRGTLLTPRYGPKADNHYCGGGSVRLVGVSQGRRKSMSVLRTA